MLPKCIDSLIHSFIVIHSVLIDSSIHWCRSCTRTRGRGAPHTGSSAVVIIFQFKYWHTCSCAFVVCGGMGRQRLLGILVQAVERTSKIRPFGNGDKFHITTQ
jgi:hypothetical protein